jgi:hypothetical protein
MGNVTPTEDIEQRIVVDYLRIRGIPHWRTPNETYTKSWSQKAKNKALGVSPGICDLFVALEGIGLLGLEMKRTKGSVTSQAQKDWIKILNTIPGIEARICKGANEAISFIEEYKPMSETSQTIF